MSGAAQAFTWEYVGIKVAAGTNALFSSISKTSRIGIWGSSVEKSMFKGITNAVPSRLARVIPANVSGKMLGAPDATDVFVTAADDIAGLNAKQIAKRLTIPYSKYGFKVIEFNTSKINIASPINRINPGFQGFGRTAGGAREFVIPNRIIPDGSTIRIVR